ncbi:MAG: tRNA (adenosine(37)-N6)-threonylcarbamoyltransferase complex ATPase subunit type 1 TsaE, partial [Patescibacteria group bacterium]
MSNALINKKIVSVSARQTQRLASQMAKNILANELRAGAFVLALEGDLGSGKTTFTQGLAKGLGVKG